MTVREASIRCALTLRSIAWTWRKKHDLYLAAGHPRLAEDCKAKCNEYWRAAHSWLRFAANH